MSITINIKRGLDLNLAGAVTGSSVVDVPASQIAIEPADFPGFTPKLAVKEGDTVSIGSPIMFDKNNINVCLTAPVSGKIARVERGERRRIIRVVIDAESQSTAADFDVKKAKNDTAELRLLLQRSGIWAMMRQLPYDIIPAPQATIANIFVTAFDSAPLAPSYDILLAGKEKEIHAGVEALCRLTEGKVFYATRPGKHIDLPKTAEHVEVSGPHPSGLPSIQAANIAPVNKGQTVVLLDAVTVARIGHLLLTGHTDWTAIIALCGSDVITPRYVRTAAGAAIAPIIEGDVKSGHNIRIIAGDVLTGINAGKEGYLHYPYLQITVIPEGDDVAEFMGWASLSPNKMSVNRSFLSKFIPGKKFAPDARLLGGRRAMIMSEQYDKVFPMDILPEYLVKAILARDIDKMEQLGIYEVTPADFALCEYIDPSKLELQRIVREGLDYLRKELE